jgi:hypothetical protein
MRFQLKLLFISGHLPTTDRVMFVWTDTVANLRASSQAVTLNIFFDHLRKQLFVRQSTRAAAYEEFLTLKQDAKRVPDCNAFVTRLKQILGRLFPTATEEREPISKYDACLAVHDLLCKLWDMPLRVRKSPLKEISYRLGMSGSSKANPYTCRVCSQLSMHLLQAQLLPVLTIFRLSASNYQEHR